VPDQVKLSFVIFDIVALWRSDWASECTDVKNCKWRLIEKGRKRSPCLQRRREKIYWPSHVCLYVVLYADSTPLTPLANILQSLVK